MPGSIERGAEFRSASIDTDLVSRRNRVADTSVHDILKPVLNGPLRVIQKAPRVGLEPTT